MNNERRLKIENVMDKMQMISDQLQGVMSDIDGLLQDEEDSRDRIPDNLQGTDTYDHSDSACAALQEAKDHVDEIDGIIEDAVSALDEAYNQ